VFLGLLLIVNLVLQWFVGVIAFCTGVFVRGVVYFADWWLLSLVFGLTSKGLPLHDPGTLVPIGTSEAGLLVAACSSPYFVCLLDCFCLLIHVICLIWCYCLC
jgi:hypothetical protein